MTRTASSNLPENSRMYSSRLGLALAACALVALGACSKEVGNNAETKPSVGAKIDRALDRTQEKLSNAGERAKEEVQQAAEKTQETISRAAGAVPYAPRQPIQDNPNAAASTPLPPASATPAGASSTSAANTTTASPPAAATSTTATTSAGPTTSVKVTGSGG
jgi:hypothetical protein